LEPPQGKKEFMKIEKIKELLNSGESITVEFKQSHQK